MTPKRDEVIITDTVSLLLESDADGTGPRKGIIETAAAAEVHSAEQWLYFLGSHGHETQAWPELSTAVTVLHLPHSIAESSNVLSGQVTGHKGLHSCM